MSVSSSMESKPNETEISVFHTFVSCMMRLQHQLHPEHHLHCQLRDPLLNVVDIPTIKDPINDMTSHTAHQHDQTCVKQAAHQQTTAGSVSTLSTLVAARHEVLSNKPEPEQYEGFYILYQSYVGDAARH